MAKWLNRTLVQDARNSGTAGHTITFTAAAAGNLLVAVAQGAVTLTTPTGWTLPTNGSAVNTGGLYVWYKTASAGESSFTTTANAANYPIAVVVYEFPAGSTFVQAAAATAQQAIASGAGPTISSLTGTNLLIGMIGWANSATSGTVATTWTLPSGIVSDVDVSTFIATTDGYCLSVAYVENSIATSFAGTSATTIGNGSNTLEKITFAVNVAASTVAASVGLTAASTLAITGVGTELAASSLLATSVLTVASAVVGSVAFAGVSTLTAAATATALTSTSLAASSTLTTMGAITVRASAALGADTALAIAGIDTTYATTGWSAASVLTASGTVVVPVSAALVATSSLAASGSIIIVSSSAALAADTTLATLGVSTSKASVVVAALSSLSVNASVIVQDAVALAAGGVLSAGGSVAQGVAAVAQLTAMSILTVGPAIVLVGRDILFTLGEATFAPLLVGIPADNQLAIGMATF